MRPLRRRLSASRPPDATPQPTTISLIPRAPAPVALSILRELLMSHKWGVAGVSLKSVASGHNKKTTYRDREATIYETSRYNPKSGLPSRTLSPTRLE